MKKQSVTKSLRIYTAAEWDADPPAVQSFPSSNGKGIVIHHTTDPNRESLTEEAEKQAAFRLARAIQQLHMKTNNWSDSGQHFLISRGGVVCEGRHGSLKAARQGQVVRGAHAGNTEANRYWFGIENEGQYSEAADMPDAQWRALVDLCALLAYWGDFDTQNIRGHKDFRATACPGKLMERLHELRRAAHVRKLELIAGKMQIRDQRARPESAAGDGTRLRELLHPSRDKFFRGRYSLAWASLASGKKSLPHRMLTSEVYYILKGTGRMTVNADTRTVRASHTIYIPSGALQWIENTGKSTLEFLCIVDPAWRKEDEEIDQPAGD